VTSRVGTGFRGSAVSPNRAGLGGGQGREGVRHAAPALIREQTYRMPSRAPFVTARRAKRGGTANRESRRSRETARHADLSVSENVGSGGEDEYSRPSRLRRRTDSDTRATARRIRRSPNGVPRTPRKRHKGESRVAAALPSAWHRACRECGLRESPNVCEYAKKKRSDACVAGGRS